MRASLPDVLVLSLDELPLLADTLKWMFVEAAGEHCGRETALDRLFELLIILLFRHLLVQDAEQAGERIDTENAFDLTLVGSERIENCADRLGSPLDLKEEGVLLTEGWNCRVRLYKPRASVLDGSWVFLRPRLPTEVLGGAFISRLRPVCLCYVSSNRANE